MTINRKTPVLVLLVMTVLAACQGKAAPGLLVEQPAPLATQAVLTISRADEIYGIWTLTSHPHYKLAYWLLRPDGSFTFSPNLDGGRPSESGQYWFKQGQLLIKDDFCPTPGKYTVTKQEIAEGSALVIRLVEDSCTARVKILTTGPKIWFGPLL